MAPGALAKHLGALDGCSCGEDSFAVGQNDFQLVLAVADGVGGWRKRGIDPARFSRCLMEHVARLVGAERDAALPAREILSRAFYGLVERYLTRTGEPPFGSSTACVVALGRGDGQLDVANLGDSGLLLIRDGAVSFRTEAQQTRFNAPYQATLRPNGDVDDMTPLAAVTRLAVQPGDVLVLGTDGLWDNLWERDIVDLVGRAATDAAPALGSLAKALVERARRAAEGPDDTPFAVEARKYGKTYAGGKPDDITALIAVVRLEAP
jgi:protein phosphatase PTC7